MAINKIRFGILGCSKIARKHCWPLTHDIDEAELAAVCDLDPAKAGRLSEEFGVPGYSDFKEMLQKENLDAVSVCTPSGCHAEHGIALAESGVHVIMEKPMALRLEDADRLIRACDSSGVQLFVVKQNRYNPAITAVKEAVDGKRFGKMVLGTVRVRWCRTQEYYDSASWRGTWEMDGGVITNQASHHIDMLEWLMGDVVSVKANIATRLNNIEVEDTATAIIKFDNGALGVIEATTATRPRDLEGSISILGEHGSVVIGGFAMDTITTWNFSTATEEDANTRESIAGNPQHETGYSHMRYLEEVVSAIESGRRGLVDGMAGRRSIELINAIYESAETDREIFLKFRPRHCRLGMPAEGNN